MQHDLSDLVTRIDAIGGTTADLLALTDVAMVGGELIAWNVKARAAAYGLVERMERAVAPTAPATSNAPLATEPQVAYAVSLIAARARSGEEGGHLSFRGGYPTAVQLAAMTRRDISALIDAMRSSYDR